MAPKKASPISIVQLAKEMKDLGAKQFSYSDEGFAVVFEYDPGQSEPHDATSTAGFFIDDGDGAYDKKTQTPRGR